MKKLKFIVASLFLSANVLGQHESTSQLSVELDPAPYILSGYSVSIKYSPKQTPRVAYMASIYQSDFPDGMMTKVNTEKGWTSMKLKTSYAAFTEFYINEERKGFYVGPSVFWYNKSAELKSINSRTEFSTIYPNARIGYIWYPFKKMNLYLNPWFNIGSEINVDQQNQLGGIEFEPNKLNYILALHIGYSFQIKKKETGHQ